MICVARCVSVPREGIATVRIANFSDESVILKQGKALAHFHPLNRDFGSINSFSVVEGTTEAQYGTSENDKPNRYTSETTEDNELTVDQESQFSSLLEELHDLFAEDNNDRGMTDLMEHTIDTGNVNPIKQAPRRLPPHKRHVVDEQLTDLLEAGRIEESVGPWSSPIVLATKKDGSYRLCIVYWKLNAVTIKDTQPLPRTDDILSGLLII